MNYTLQTGARAEEAAAGYLRSMGYKIVATNWRSGRYELDIVAEKCDTLHFVEVKCRKAGGMTTPEEAMTPAKAGALLKAANAYIESNAVMLDCQIDLVAADLMPDGSYIMRLIPNAVTLQW